MQVFSREHPRLTLSEVARLTGLTRATARRVLLTLQHLGYARSDGRGRVLLAELGRDEVDELIGPGPLPSITDRTITKPTDLHDELARVRRQGWALVDQELEAGLRSIGAPLRDGHGRALAAINVSTHAGRVSLDAIRKDFLPALLDTAGQISERLARR